MKPSLATLHEMHLISQKRWIQKSIEIEFWVYMLIGGLGFAAGFVNPVETSVKLNLMGTLLGAGLAVHLRIRRHMNKHVAANMAATFLILSFFFMSFSMALHLAMVLSPGIHLSSIAFFSGIAGGLVAPTMGQSVRKLTRAWFHSHVINSDTLSKIIDGLQVYANLHPKAHRASQIMLSTTISNNSTLSLWQLEILDNDTFSQIPMPSLLVTPDALMHMNPNNNEMPRLTITLGVAPLTHHQIITLHQDVQRLFPGHDLSV